MKVRIHLTGGLGNQLFQIAAALYLAEKDDTSVYCEAHLGKPRLGPTKEAEIFSFHLPRVLNEEHRYNSQLGKFCGKVAGYNLRTGISPTFLENMRIVQLITKCVSSLFISLYLFSPTRILSSKGVGYSELKKTTKNLYLIGYFQTYKYASVVKNLLNQISVKSDGPNLTELRSMAATEKPLVVHFRFGDYLLEKDFGIPSVRYYSEAVNQALANSNCESIWVFSDDIELAKSKFYVEGEIPVRWIQDVDNSVASTLEAMRLGHAYVIANSSFSWWGAYLSKQEEVVVIAPSPWFKNLPEPKDLIPSNWHRLDAIYE